MNIKNGKYVIINQKEYEIIKDNLNKNYDILSINKNDIKDGFIKSDEYDNYYVKQVSQNDFKQMIKTGIISKIFYIESHGIYKGRKVEINGRGKSKTVRISTDHEGIAEELGMKMIEQAYYSKIVNVSEVEIIEEERVLTIDDL